MLDMSGKQSVQLFLCLTFLGIHQSKCFSIILVSALGYSWGIRGVYVGYSWGIRMYRVCVGYVSGMYRESVEADWEVSGGDGYRMQID